MGGSKDIKKMATVDLTPRPLEFRPPKRKHNKNFDGSYFNKMMRKIKRDMR